MTKKLFTIEDIKTQLNEKQIKQLEHIIYMAKETKNMQGVVMGVGNERLIVFPSGKMMFDRCLVCSGMMTIKQLALGSKNTKHEVCKKHIEEIIAFLNKRKAELKGEE